MGCIVSIPNKRRDLNEMEFSISENSSSTYENVVHKVKKVLKIKKGMVEMEDNDLVIL